MKEHQVAIEQLATILNRRDISVEKVATDIGTSKHNIYNALKRGDLKLSLYHSILNHPEVSRHLPPPTSTPPAALDTPSERILPIVVDAENHEHISLVPVYAQAGYMRGFEDPEFVRTLPLSSTGTYDDGTYRDFEIKGDSMENYFFERDIVRAKYLPELYWDRQLAIGQLFVILHKTDGIVFKQVTAHDPVKGQLTLHSFNDYYEDYTIHLRDVQQLWYYTEYRSSRKFKLVR